MPPAAGARASASPRGGAGVVAQRLPPLRDEIILHPGPDGSRGCARLDSGGSGARTLFSVSAGGDRVCSRAGIWATRRQLPPQ